MLPSKSDDIIYDFRISYVFSILSYLIIIVIKILVNVLILSVTIFGIRIRKKKKKQLLNYFHFIDS